MSLLPATNRQLPDQSIMDHFDRQTYLGNQYSANKSFTVSTSEIPLLYLLNSQTGSPSNAKALFQNVLKVTESTASKTVTLNVYANPTVAANGVETVTTVADSSGSLNNTYWTFYVPGGAGFYVWYNINSAGTDPAVVGLTGIAVAAATNAADSAIASATRTAINTAAVGVTATLATHVVTLTMNAAGPFTPAADSVAPTGFAFAVTAGAGALVTPVNMRFAYGNNSVGQVSSTPTVSANGTLVDVLFAPAQAVSTSNILKILDNTEGLLITSIASASSTAINVLMQWFEI